MKQTIQNLAWAMVNGVYGGVLIVLCTPLFVSLVGIEGYAIISFWLMMQLLLLVFDMGLGATLVKEFASASSGPNGNRFKLDLLKTFEALLIVIAVVLAILLIFFANLGGGFWFKSSKIPSDEMSTILMIMAFALALQFPSSLYISGLVGLHRHRDVSLLQIGWNTARYGLGVVGLLFGKNLLLFFIVQCAVALMQLLSIRWILLSKIENSSGYRAQFSLTLILRAMPFSMGIAATSLIGIILTSTDRLILSVMLTTEELGKYALAFSAAGLLQMAVQPFYRVYFPRFSALVSYGDYKALRELYFDGCSFIAALIIPIAVVGVVFADYLFFAWMGYSYPETTLTFRILLVFMGLSGLMWLPAALQHANNWTQLHTQTMAAALLIGVPISYYSIEKYGLVGGSFIWVINGTMQITLELFLMHRRILIGDARTWLIAVAVRPLVVSVLISFVALNLVPAGLGRVASLAWPTATGLLIVFILLLLYRSAGNRFSYGR